MEVSGVNSEDAGVMCTWVTRVSAAMVEVEVSGDNGQHEVSSVMAEVEVSGGGVRCQQRGRRRQQQGQRCWVSMMTKGVSCEVVSMAAVGKVPWRCRHEVSTARGEVSAAMAEVLKVSPRCGRCRQ